MSKRAHLSFRLVGRVAVILGLFAAACGDDEGAGDGGAGNAGSEAGGSAGGAAGSSGRAGAAPGGSGAGGMGGSSGMLAEGRQCQSTADCASGLACIPMELPDGQLQICARPCTAAGNECPAGEMCDSPFTQLARDAHCINSVPEPFEYCGVGQTSVCGGDMTCLYLPDYTIGLCVNLCATDPGEDAGVPGLLASCPAPTSTCVGGVVRNEAVGVCGSEVARDEECGFAVGKFCEGTDACIPDDLADEMSTQRCREDCTTSRTCQGGGACTRIDPTLSYCKK